MTYAAAYPQSLAHLMHARVGDLLTADVRVCLLGGGGVTDGALAWYGELLQWEITDAPYVAGGVSLTGKVVETDEDGMTVLRCAPVVWPQAGWLHYYAVCYVATGDPATSPLLSWVWFDAGVQTDADGSHLSSDPGVYAMAPGPQAYQS